MKNGNTFVFVSGACLSQRSFFAQPFKQELNAYRYCLVTVCPTYYSIFACTSLNVF